MRLVLAPRLLLAASLALLAVPLDAGTARGAGATGGGNRKIWTFTFEGDTLGQAPPHTVVRGGTWAVEEDSTAPGGRVLRQEMHDDGVAWHYIQFTRPQLEDVTISVRFRIESGEIDPSAGILFQLDPKGRSGYLVRLRGETHEIAFHYLLYGKRRDIRFAKIAWPEPGTWHTLGLRREGHRLTVSYDGHEVMRARDERYRKGTIGLWTENDSVVDFADLEVGVP
jgi:hypothetical protein